MCTGNATAHVDTNGTVTVQNSGTAETYTAIGAIISEVAKKSAEGATKSVAP